MWDTSFRSVLNALPGLHRDWLYLSHTPLAVILLISFMLTAVPSHARAKKTVIQYGAGLIVNVPYPEPEVAQVVEEVSQNTIIRGTKEYNKDEYVTGAAGAASSTVFARWTEGGKVFYKVRAQALDPRNFKDGGDVGTLAVRYVVQPQGDNNTVLRIDALFVEEFRHTIHTSNGSVESSEYKDIQDRIGAVELMKKETVDALREKEEHQAKKKFGITDGSVEVSTTAAAPKPIDGVHGEAADTGVAAVVAPVGPATSPEIASATVPASSSPETPAYELKPGESIEQHVAELRRQVERLVKKPGAPLQSAPFHTATSLKSLEPGAEVLILISTPYWYGVETHEGEHGWVRRDQLELVP